jgi:hypothetical protein
MTYMSGFWHYLAVTPLRDYPWWGLVLFGVGDLVLLALMLLLNQVLFGWARRRS